MKLAVPCCWRCAGVFRRFVNVFFHQLDVHQLQFIGMIGVNNCKIRWKAVSSLKRNECFFFFCFFIIIAINIDCFSNKKSNSLCRQRYHPFNFKQLIWANVHMGQIGIARQTWFDRRRNRWSRRWQNPATTTTTKKANVLQTYKKHNILVALYQRNQATKQCNDHHVLKINQGAVDPVSFFKIF